MTLATTDAELVRCRSVTVVYGRGEAAVTALAGIDLAIAPGERLGLVGRSGSGKTTLLHALGGLLLPDDGDVMLGGRPITVKCWTKEVGILDTRTTPGIGGGAPPDT